MRSDRPIVLLIRLPSQDAAATQRRVDGWRALLLARGAAVEDLIELTSADAAYAEAARRQRPALLLHLGSTQPWDAAAAELLLGALPAEGLHERFDLPPQAPERDWGRGLPGDTPDQPDRPPRGGTFVDPTPDTLPGEPGLPEEDWDLPGWSPPGGSGGSNGPAPTLDGVAPRSQIEGGTNDVHVQWSTSGGEITGVQTGAPPPGASQLFALTTDSSTLSAATVVGYVRITPVADGAQEEWRWSPAKAWVAPFRLVPLSTSRYETMRAIVAAARGGSTTSAAWEATWPDVVAFLWRGIADLPVHAASKPARRWLLGTRRPDNRKAGTEHVLYLSLATGQPAGALLNPRWYLLGGPDPVVLETGHHIRVMTTTRPSSTVDLYPELS